MIEFSQDVLQVNNLNFIRRNSPVFIWQKARRVFIKGESRSGLLPR